MFVPLFVLISLIIFAVIGVASILIFLFLRYLLRQDPRERLR